MKIFNAIQLVLLFVSLPFLAAWLHTASFWGAGAAFWFAICAEIAMICWTTFCYHEQL